MHLAVIALAFVGVMTQDFRPTGTEGEVMRLQISRPGHSTCLLVHADATYRLEERDLHSVKVRESALTPEELSDLRTLLDNPPLSDIDPRSIPLPVVREAIRETVVLAIARDLGWKNLHFGDAASRRSVQVQVDWLLELLRKAKDRKGTPLPEKAANHCVPATSVKPLPVQPAGTKSETEAAPGAAPAAVVQVPKLERPPFLVLIRSLRFYASARRQCLLVRHDGAFRFEKTSQDPGQEMKGKIVFGRLSAEEIGELKGLLEGADVQTATPPEGEEMFREGDMASAYFFREGRPYGVRAGSYFGLSGSRNQIVGDRRALEPFVKWLTRVDKKNLPPIAGATLDDCRVQ